MSNFNENKHPRNDDGEFVDKDGEQNSNGIKEQIEWARKSGKELPLNNDGSLDEVALRKMYDERDKSRVKVGEITNPIYDDMVLSNGRRVKDILTRVVEMPLTGSAGAEHIEGHQERKGMVGKYIGFMNDIINDPDYVFEDKTHENTLQIEKRIDKHTIMTVSLNFDNSDHTNTLITMRNEGDESFTDTIKKYEKIGKVLYKKPKT